ncbi:MAG TPA: AbrB/MazE/SpoVT family DNA-binding domain-containing protein [Candidatus Baltobacteraceae bacterium]|jgi:antitoxin MazE|nr:AbrB/MazE/SpoVT family DNA-binding domain-containing protein [Candidatus Baltobacteraceae bacterium]
MNTTTIAQWGNSLGVRLPKLLVEQAHLHKGDALLIETTEDGILLRPTHPGNLAEMVAAITLENLHGETFSGNPVGNEVW